MKTFIKLVCLLVLCPTMAAAQVIEYYHLDVVGNVRAVTDSAGNVIERHDYLPFGEEWNPTGGNQPRRFTGKERDAETGLDYFGARYYGSKIGRFTTVDPQQTIKENILDPQRWNKYAYGRNNPLRFVDPDGRDWLYRTVMGAQYIQQFGDRSSFSVLFSGLGGDIDRAGPQFQDQMATDLTIASLISLGMPVPRDAPIAQPGRGEPIEVAISRSRSPEAARHIEEAQAAGQPEVVTLNRGAARPNRAASLKGTERAQRGFDRDEYPPACCSEGGAGASVRPIPAGDNRSAGGQLGAQIKGVPDGARVRITTKEN